MININQSYEEVMDNYRTHNFNDVIIDNHHHVISMNDIPINHSLIPDGMRNTEDEAIFKLTSIAKDLSFNFNFPTSREMISRA
jgi:F0F1-type ATP synthase gamma subunit